MRASSLLLFAPVSCAAGKLRFANDDTTDVMTLLSPAAEDLVLNGCPAGNFSLCELADRMTAIEGRMTNMETKWNASISKAGSLPDGTFCKDGPGSIFDDGTVRVLCRDYEEAVVTAVYNGNLAFWQTGNPISTTWNPSSIPTDTEDYFLSFEGWRHIMNTYGAVDLTTEVNAQMDSAPGHCGFGYKLKYTDFQLDSSYNYRHAGGACAVTTHGSGDLNSCTDGNPMWQHNDQSPTAAWNGDLHYAGGTHSSCINVSIPVE